MDPRRPSALGEVSIREGLVERKLEPKPEEQLLFFLGRIFYRSNTHRKRESIESSDAYF